MLGLVNSQNMCFPFFISLSFLLSHLLSPLPFWGTMGWINFDSIPCDYLNVTVCNLHVQITHQICEWGAIPSASVDRCKIEVIMLETLCQQTATQKITWIGKSPHINLRELPPRTARILNTARNISMSISSEHMIPVCTFQHDFINTNSLFKILCVSCITVLGNTAAWVMSWQVQAS
jgi:hypothetical protein